MGRPSFREFLKDLVLRIAGAVLAVGVIVLLVFAGEYFNLGFLQSQGGLLISVIILMEIIFFTLILAAVLTDKM